MRIWNWIKDNILGGVGEFLSAIADIFSDIDFSD